jgi:hypothetical protein
MNYKLFILQLLAALALASCRGGDFRTETFVLQDSTTILEIRVPNELDTFHMWVDSDDTHCGDQKKYRFSNSDYPVFQESGFFHATHPDSSYRMTFSHFANLDCYESSFTPDLIKMAKGLEQNAKKDSVDFVLYSTEQKQIGTLDFYTMKFKTDLLPRQKYQSTVIRSFVKADGIDLKVEFECASNNCDGFIERMTKSLESIRILKKM